MTKTADLEMEAIRPMRQRSATSYRAAARTARASSDRARRPFCFAVLHALLSAGRPPRRRRHHRGRGRQPFPGFQCGHRRGGHRPLPSARSGGHPGAGRQPDPHVGDRFLLRSPGGSGGETRLARARRCGAPRFVLQLGRGSHGGRHEAGALLHRPRQIHRLLWLFPWPHHGRAVAHRAQGRAAPRLRTAGAGRGARPLSQLLSLPVRPDARQLRGGVRQVYRRHAAEDHRAGRRSGGYRHRTGAGRRRLHRAAAKVLR